jgi:hypothetical protein
LAHILRIIMRARGGPHAVSKTAKPYCIVNHFQMAAFVSICTS